MVTAAAPRSRPPISMRSGTPFSSHSLNLKPGRYSGRSSTRTRTPAARSSSATAVAAWSRSPRSSPREDRHDHDLLGGDARRQSQPAVVSVRHHDTTDQSRGRAPRGRIGILLAAVTAGVADIERPGEALAEVVRGSRLKCLAVSHQRFERVGVDGAGEPLALALAAPQHGDRQDVLDRVRVDVVEDGQRLRDRPLVQFDTALWLATDPATALPSAPTLTENFVNRSVDCLGYWEREFLVDDANLYRDLARSDRPAAALRITTSDRPARSARYREFMRPNGFDDELRAVMRVDGRSWAQVGLFREKGRAPFAAEETELLASMSAPLAAAVRDHARRVSPPLADG